MRDDSQVHASTDFPAVQYFKWFLRFGYSYKQELGDIAFGLLQHACMLEHTEFAHLYGSQITLRTRSKRKSEYPHTSKNQFGISPFSSCQNPCQTLFYSQPRNMFHHISYGYCLAFETLHASNINSRQTLMLDW